jgi:asparagine synthase (glutamine-hydrolysing)
MCGIIGIASRNTIEDRSWLVPGRDSMRHRGPDDAGEWWSPDGRVGFGHRRLAIVDLSPRGHQPMQNATGELCIVFNGEIYNFRDLRQELAVKGYAFRSNTDTEVVSAAYQEWGTRCLVHMNGMFAFGLYDAQQQMLFLARDRAGEKPLFYHHANGTLRFASELKALLGDPALPRRINPESLDCYLAMGFVPGELCILQGFKRLPPAHAIRFDLQTGEAKIWRYWQLPELEFAGAQCRVDGTALVNELETLLEDAVRCQLVADVPVGVLLSGGVDSSLVTAMAVRATPKVKTFTIRFPGYGKYDESEHARLIARHFGTEHIELEAEPTTVALLPMLARQFDEPLIDSSMIPTYLVSRLVRRHCTVALGGDGGDELFGGYGHYNRLLWLQSRFGSVPHWLRRILADGAEMVLPLGFKGRNWLQAMGTDLDADVPLVASYYDRHSRARLLGKQFTRLGVAEQIREALIPKTDDLLQRATRMDFETYLPEDILVKVDRASMLNSLEIRAPMLDFRLIEFAFGKVPSHLKATASSRKVLLKKLVRRLLPQEFDQHRKQGFAIPLASWLKSGPWLKYFREVLLDDSQVLFDRRVVKTLLDGQQSGRSNGERLFGLVMIELWRREYGVQI